jgi:hypothetical protein
MTVPSLPKTWAPTCPGTLAQILLEEHFGLPIAFMHDSDGRFDTLGTPTSKKYAGVLAGGGHLCSQRDLQADGIAAA